MIQRRVLTRRQEYRIWLTVSPGTNNQCHAHFIFLAQHNITQISLQPKKKQTQCPINTGSLMHRTVALLSHLHQLPLLSASYVRHSIQTKEKKYFSCRFSSCLAKYLWNSLSSSNNAFRKDLKNKVSKLTHKNNQMYTWPDVVAYFGIYYDSNFQTVF